MDLIRKIPKKFTKKFGNKVINGQYFCRKTGLYICLRRCFCTGIHGNHEILVPYWASVSNFYCKFTCCELQW